MHYKLIFVNIGKLSVGQASKISMVHGLIKGYERTCTQACWLHSLFFFHFHWNFMS